MNGSASALADPATLIVMAFLLSAFSGVPGLLPRLRGGRGQRLGVLLHLVAALSGSIGALRLLLSGRTVTCSLDWTLPFGPADIAIDPLSALFLLPVLLVSACSSVYAVEYRPGATNRGSEPKLTFFTGIITAAMIGIPLARNGAFFLVAWEIMALSCYFLMSVDDEKAEVREAAAFYLVTTHIGTLALFAMFSLLKARTGSFLFPAAGLLDATGPLASAIFFTLLFGCGLKAGLMPLHVWLPSAHANAPSHISALMSGVLIKMGIYGIVRITSFFGHIPLWWGVTLLVGGIVSGILGVLFAIGQHDLKRLLAYHSIENIGIITMGIGTAVIGRSLDSPTLVFLGMGGALLHVLNHATFKALLFFAAGAVIHATGTREIDLMGGIARRAPGTAFFFLVGAVAICGLPPLNGFVSELLVYLGLFEGVLRTKGAALPFFALAIPALALIGGLAAACFVKVYGVAFLGTERSPAAKPVHEAGPMMRGTMAFLALICVGIGFFPSAVVPLLREGVLSWDPLLAAAGLDLQHLAPLGWLTPLGAILLGSVLLLAWQYRRLLRAGETTTTVTWDCGYLQPTPRMQYTSSSFADTLVGLFAAVLRPHRQAPTVKGPFPGKARFTSHVPETVLEDIYLPLFSWANARLSLIRRLQHGQLHLYILYTFITLVLLLIWAR